MKKQALLLSLFLLHFLNSFSSIFPGNWNGFLKIKEDAVLPFIFTIKTEKNSDTLQEMTISNAEEKITLSYKRHTKDSLDFVFPNFNSFLRIHVDSKNKLSGYWYNKSKGDNYKIAFSAQLIKKEEKSIKTETYFNGKWSTVFAPKTKDEEVAYGIFDQKNDKLTGTFLTETGDYRYLVGKAKDTEMVLSCFDGAHAFLFKANYSKTSNSITGKFYSGIHWESNWLALKSDINPLRNPDSITYILPDRKFEFTFPDMHGNNYSFPNEKLKNKVVIVQILGTWCPNCLDESRYFKELMEKYHEEGLEVISIAYENGKTAEKRIAIIEKYKKTNDFPFTYLDGGCYCDNLVMKNFSMLNKFSSYPTSFILDRNGKVVSIHTGFSGPGTGDYYKEYCKKTESLIRKLLFDY